MNVFLLIVKRLGCLIAIYCLFLAGTAHALFTSYTDETDFFNAIAGLNQQTLDFENYFGDDNDGDRIHSGDTVEGITFDYNIEGYDGQEKATMMVTDKWYATSGDNSLGLYNRDASFWAGDVFSMAFDNPVNALGMYFITSPDDDIWAEDLRLVTDFGIAYNALEFIYMPDGDRAFFVGLYSSDQFTSASLDFAPEATGVFPFNVDDITIASATAPVPEPSTLVLMGAGLLLGAIVNRRRRS